MASRTEFGDYFSSRMSKLSRKVKVEKFVAWAKEEKRFKTLYLRNLLWAKTSGSPSHEYLIVKVVDFDNVIADTDLRIERDTTSWFTIRGLSTRSKCVDTVTICSEASPAQHVDDTILASFAFHCFDINLSYLVAVLDIINTKACIYNVYTFNCWWFVARIWKCLARCGAREHSTFELRQGIRQDRVLMDMMRWRAGWDAVEFATFLDRFHFATVRRAFRSPEAREELEMVERVSAVIDSDFTARMRERISSNIFKMTCRALTHRSMEWESEARYAYVWLLERRKLLQHTLVDMAVKELDHPTRPCSHDHYIDTFGTMCEGFSCRRWSVVTEVRRGLARLVSTEEELVRHLSSVETRLQKVLGPLEHVHSAWMHLPRKNDPRIEDAEKAIATQISSIFDSSETPALSWYATLQLLRDLLSLEASQRLVLDSGTMNRLLQKSERCFPVFPFSPTFLQYFQSAESQNRRRFQIIERQLQECFLLSGPFRGHSEERRRLFGELLQERINLLDRACQWSARASIEESIEMSYTRASVRIDTESIARRIQHVAHSFVHERRQTI
ncbi:hypothetical protein JAAARDRAFT_196793 [Jaapia argillacea MUCL 33604]|uniref:Uncharacterized protein n=1 Tax=Jaapia argillacea MUCL 33604 TaxID=933084 RepID=A0A067PGJ0_9AGAM|nr:hypothetical protein JAAARDRAFT_196793 [Jaapia argillacea MUCL 33604]